jgi:predicted dithiol-disulfide oxidoreductase (DUF899 family)
MSISAMVSNRKVVSRAKWAEARKAFLAREKELTRQRDEISRQRRELPWVKVERSYVALPGMKNVELHDQ